MRRLRYMGALLLALLGVVLVFGALVDSIHLCRDVVAGNAIAKQCGPPSLGELIPLALLIALLLAPELSELSIGGLVSLKREVWEARASQKRFEEYTSPVVEAALSDRLDPEAVDEKQKEYERTEPGDEVGKQDEAPRVESGPRQRDALVQEFQQISDEVARWWNLAKRGDDPAFTSRLVAYLEAPAGQRELLLSAEDKFALAALPRKLSPSEARSLVRWGTVFEDEIKSTLAVKKGLETDAPPSGQLLEKAVETARRLLRLLPSPPSWD